MTAADIALKDLPLLSCDDSLQLAIDYMDALKLTHYPVVEEGKFMGLIYEDAIYNADNWLLSIREAKLRLPEVAVITNDHFLQVVNKFIESNVSCIAIIDPKGHFAGAITRDSIVDVFGNSSIVQDRGSELEILLARNDYYLTEITRVIESTGVKILGTYLRNAENTNQIILTVKLNERSIEETLSALDRFGYTVSASYELLRDQGGMQDRYDNLMHFLNI
jgi:predicted transcriptional regulator